MYLFALYMNMGDEYLEMYFFSITESNMDKKSVEIRKIND